jgi:hypothetical protein
MSRQKSPNPGVISLTLLAGVVKAIVTGLGKRAKGSWRLAYSVLAGAIAALFRNCSIAARRMMPRRMRKKRNKTA